MIILKKAADHLCLYCTCMAIILANAIVPFVKFVETRTVKTNTEVTCDNIKSQQHYSLTDVRHFSDINSIFVQVQAQIAY